MKRILLIFMTVLVAVSTALPVFADEYAATPEIGDQYDIMTADYLTSPVEGFPDFYYTGALSQWHFLVFYSYEYENFIQIRYNATPESIIWNSTDNSLTVKCTSFANFYTYQLATDETTGTDYWNFVESNTLAEKTYNRVTSFNYSGDDIIYNEFGEQVFPVPLQKVISQSLEREMQTVAGVMKILALCGIGCLASLISLPVLQKVLQNFQVK